jgi:hypothetical protein
MSCEICGYPEHRHAWFSKDDLDTMEAKGRVLSVCDAYRGRAFFLVTKESIKPKNPHTAESLLEISQ